MPRKPISAVKLARKLLQASGDQMEFLRQHDFKGDVDMKDYKLHRRLSAEFAAEVDRASEELSNVYGKPFRKGTGDTNLIPLGGVVRYAAWQRGNQRLFVAAARPERECPFLLLLGVAAGEPVTHRQRTQRPSGARSPRPAGERAKDHPREPKHREQPRLPGLTQELCERCLYLALKPGETPAGQQDAVYQHWGMLYKKLRRERKARELPAGVQGPTFILTLPDEESFGDFTVSRYPCSVGETEEQMVPLVVQAELLLRDFAQETGRCSARIEKGTVFTCDDGRRIPLSRCTYGLLRTDRDYAIKAKGKKNHASAVSGSI